MRSLTHIKGRLISLWRRKRLDRDLSDELSFHLAMKTQATGDEREARRIMGNLTAIQEQCRSLWTFTRIETCWQDVRYAARTLARTPSVSLIAVLALALGIGANTTVFTVVSSALSFDLGVPHIDRLVILSLNDTAHRGDLMNSLPGLYASLPEVKTIVHPAAYQMSSVNVTDRSGVPERYRAVKMTASGFSTIGRNAALGRVFGPQDDASVVLLSHQVWQNRYGLAPSIIGQSIRVDGSPFVVIGVMPQNVRFPEDTDLYMPLDSRELLARSPGRPILAFGRLADGVDIAQARAELTTIAGRVFPDAAADVRLMLEIYGAYDGRVLFWAMLFAVAFVLLIACADVASLLLSRAAARAREISIRIAIGAGRARIVRQLLIESLLLSVVSGACGWIVAMAGLHWFDGFTGKTGRPAWMDFSMRPSVFLYLAAISIGAGILFGLAPAVQLARVDVNNAVKEGGQGASGGTRGRSLSSLLVVVQMALCVMLLTGAGLMIRSSLKLYSAPLGVNTAGVLTMQVDLPEPKYPKPDDRIAFYRRLQSRLESLPGVETASLTSNLPAAGWLEFARDSEDSSRIAGLIVGATYFRVMQVNPTRGRLFNDNSVMVNESFAAQYWPGESPLGKQLRLAPAGSAPRWFEVAGVVPNIQQNFQRPLQTDPLVYVPYAAAPRSVMSVVARTRVPPATLETAFRRELQKLDDELPAAEMRTLEEHMTRHRLNVTAFATLFSMFGAIALVLAFAGLYGVMAHSVSRRTQEIGIRGALGASRRDLLLMVFAQGLQQVGIGLGVGLPLAFALTRLLRRALVGVSPSDPITLAAVIIVLAVAGVLGCAIPARRATQIDPARALR